MTHPVLANEMLRQQRAQPTGSTGDQHRPRWIELARPPCSHVLAGGLRRRAAPRALEPAREHLALAQRDLWLTASERAGQRSPSGAAAVVVAQHEPSRVLRLGRLHEAPHRSLSQTPETLSR